MECDDTLKISIALGVITSTKMVVLLLKLSIIEEKRSYL